MWFTSFQVMCCCFKVHWFIKMRLHCVIVNKRWHSIVIFHLQEPRQFVKQWWMYCHQSWLVVSLLENQVMCHYTFPLKSNFNGMGIMPFHHTLIVVKGNMTMPPSWLPKWNGTHAIPLYNGCSGKEHDNATLFITKMEWDSCHPPYINPSGRQWWQCHLD